MRKWKLVALLVAMLMVVLPVAVLASPQAGDIVFTVGNASYQYNGKVIPMSAAPMILNGHAYIPVQGVTQALDLDASWDATNRTITLAPPSESSISGQIGLADGTTEGGYNLPVTVSIGSGAKLNALLDTGASLSAFPDSYLRGLGYSPVLEATAILASGTSKVFMYRIPYPVVWQDGTAKSLGSGMVNVIGVVGADSALIGCDILSADNFTLHDGIWTLTVPTY